MVVMTLRTVSAVGSTAKVRADGSARTVSMGHLGFRGFIRAATVRERLTSHRSLTVAARTAGGLTSHRSLTVAARTAGGLTSHRSLTVAARTAGGAEPVRRG